MANINGYKNWEVARWEDDNGEERISLRSDGVLLRRRNRQAHTYVAKDHKYWGGGKKFWVRLTPAVHDAILEIVDKDVDRWWPGCSRTEFGLGPVGRYNRDRAQGAA